MSAFRFAASIFLLAGCNHAADPITSGSMSSQLVLAVSYQSTESKFTVVLTNRTSDSLKLQLEPRQFHGRIVVTQPTGIAVEYLDSAFIPAVLTSQWVVPIHTLQPHATVTWVLPIFKLQDIHANPLSVQTLQGSTVHAKLDELAIAPPSGRHISDNAKQVSAPITIPSQPK